ncbi:ATP-binding protein [Streptomyces sp. R302]|uniref:ATP-binding protein n=1 Tax=unclassified Streptomyces TaxID=2593676 RepID=UPI00145CD3CD|nr:MULTISPECIES: ATP-binding protein [unclassified Streptomyces]NML55194.1 ATP-binding protein [Streptomyces sp. R301]NML83776.1 ATP-binding protein [Streptomyces sp. R302]
MSERSDPMSVGAEVAFRPQPESSAEVALSGPARGLNSFAGISEHVMRVLQRRGVDMAVLGVPPQPEPEDGLWEDVAVPQARAHLNLWRQSIRDASQDDYLRFRFPRREGEEPLADGLQALDEMQQPDFLRSWLDALVKAKAQKKRPELLNLIVPGNIGSGKSALACGVGNEAAARGLWVMYVKHSTYLTWRRPDSAPRGMSAWEVQKRFVECDLLILDEVCGGMNSLATDFVERESTDLVDARGAAGRPTVYTTNLRGRRKPNSGAGVVIADILGERFVSRLEDRAHVLRVVGPDRRTPRKQLDW